MNATDAQVMSWRGSGEADQKIAAEIAEWARAQEHGSVLPGNEVFGTTTHATKEGRSVQPPTPGPPGRRPLDSSTGQDITRALASLEDKFPAAIIWFGRATGNWWAMADAGHRATLLEADSPSALSTALARLDVAALRMPDSRGSAPRDRRPRVPHQQREARQA